MNLNNLNQEIATIDASIASSNSYITAVSNFILDDWFFTLLYRMVDFTGIPQGADHWTWIDDNDTTPPFYAKIQLHASVTMPASSAFDNELISYKQELTDQTNITLNGLQRRRGIIVRWQGLSDSRMAAYRLGIDRPNHATWLDQIIIDDDTVTLGQLEVEDALYKAEYDSESYKRNREKELPLIKDLIISMWERFVEGRPANVTTDAIEAKRQAIKTKYPKS